MEVVSLEDIRKLLEYFSKSSFRIKENDIKTTHIQKKCEELFAKDYSFSVINNVQGVLSSSYPSYIIVLEQPINSLSSEAPCNRSNILYESGCDSSKLRDLIQKARIARCRSRFPVPVILLDGKYICRSATLSGGPEIYGRSGIEFLFAANTDLTDEEDEELKDLSLPQCSGDWQLFSKVRSQDIRLLKTLSVGLICDLMVEKKKVKFGMNVTSSEKVDKENRYSDFSILSLPYPGCEFFREYRDNEYSAEGLVFDWNQGYVDVQLVVPQDTVSSQLDIDWTTYTSWDVVTLTQNYMKLLLKYVLEGTSGLLVHCISGWDRTPLFISLLRLSLWADGKIHASLSPSEIAYLTVAYDWFLFGHNLPDRLSKGEEIFFFCFYMLKHLCSEEFSAHIIKSGKEKRNNSDTHLEGMLFEDDSVPVGCRGSNTSLSSSCSSVSSRSQDNPPAVFPVHNQDSGDENCLGNGNYSVPYSGWHNPSVPANGDIYPRNGTPSTLTNSNDSEPLNGNSPSKHFPSTSPVAVPSGVRQRSESSSSMCCGSWQIISGTGSIRSSVSTRDSLSSPTWELNRNSSSSKSSLSSRYQDADSSDKSWSKNKLLQRRRERLQAVRTVIYNLYSSVIGFKFGNGTDGNPGSSLANLLDQFAEKVGIRSVRTSTV